MTSIAVLHAVATVAATVAAVAVAWFQPVLTFIRAIVAMFA